MYADDDEAEDRNNTREAYLRQVAIDDLRHVLSTKQGRRFVWRLLAKTKPFHNPFNGDPSARDYRCGVMSVGQDILADVHEHCGMDTYVKMYNDFKEIAERKNDN